MDELLESFGSQALFRLSATEDDFGGATPVRTRASLELAAQSFQGLAGAPSTA